MNAQDLEPAKYDLSAQLNYQGEIFPAPHTYRNKKALPTGRIADRNTNLNSN